MTPEQRAARLHHHMYETCEGIREQSERIVTLEELVLDMWGFIENADCLNDNAGCTDYCEHDTTDDGCCKTGKCWYEQRLRELGVEVE